MGLLGIGLLAAPTILKLGARVAGVKPKKSRFEKKLLNQIDVLETDLQQPLSQRSEFKAGKSQLDLADRRNKETAVNAVGAGNITNDAKLATLETTNEAFSQGMNQLLANVARFRDFDRNRLLRLLGSAEQIKNNRIQRFGNNINSILQPLAQAGQSFVLADLLANQATN